MARDQAIELDELTVEDLEGTSKTRRSAKATMERNHIAQRESIERIKAKAIANGTMRADPELRVRHVDPESLRPKPPPGPPKRAKPLYDVEVTKEEHVHAPPRPVEEAAIEAAGLEEPPEAPPAAPPPEPSSESLRGRKPPEWNPPKREKTCKRCRLKFVPRSGNQRYCDRVECRTRLCERDECAVRFEIHSQRPGQKFCSQECSHLAMQAADSNPEQESEAPPAAPGGPSSAGDPDSHSRAESPPDEAPGPQGELPAAPELPPDSSQELEEAASRAESEDARYVELLYRLAESDLVPPELRIRALELIHELWVERAA